MMDAPLRKWRRLSVWLRLVVSDSCSAAATNDDKSASCRTAAVRQAAAFACDSMRSMSAIVRIPCAVFACPIHYWLFEVERVTMRNMES